MPYTEAQWALFHAHSHIEKGKKEFITYHEEDLVEVFTKLRQGYFLKAEDEFVSRHQTEATKLMAKVELLDEMIKFLKHEAEFN